jgi:hypothetical protein
MEEEEKYLEDNILLYQSNFMISNISSSTIPQSDWAKSS